jgi:multiple sugar transport system ATP-binding protein
MAEVVLKGVYKKYGDVEAVKDLHLRCDDGEFMCLLGPSGCGKSSTLRMIAGLEQISEGEIYIGGLLSNDVSPKDRNIAMVFENYALYPHLSVYENIAFPLKIRNFSRSDVRRKVEELAELLDMTDFLKSATDRLGDGQKQRVSIARALVRDPDVFLMDEPISHLDAKLRARMRSELKRLQRETGITCIYVTHDQIEAMALGDKIAIMNDGILQQLGTPEEVFDNPVNEFVGGFIGEPPMNFMDCRIAEEKGSYFLESASLKVCWSEIAPKIKAKGALPNEVRVGIRPTDIKVALSEFEGESLAAEVYTVEPRGDGVILTVKLGDEIIRVDSAEEFYFRPGDAIHLAMEKDRIHIFEKSSGTSLL